MRKRIKVSSFAVVVLLWAAVFTVLMLIGAPGAFAANETKPFSDFIQSLINIGRGIAGAIAVLIIVFGAIKLKASQGNPQSQQAAKITIAGAFAGLVLVLFAADIVNLIKAAAHR